MVEETRYRVRLQESYLCNELNFVQILETNYYIYILYGIHHTYNSIYANALPCVFEISHYSTNSISIPTLT